VKLHGLEASRRFAAELTVAAQSALAALDRNHAFLAALIGRMAERRK
jgi:hypothetical protein